MGNNNIKSAVKRKDGKKAKRKGSNTASRDLNPILNKRKCVATFFTKNYPKFFPLFLSTSIFNDSAHLSILV
jgi:hypothetical protein